MEKATLSLLRKLEEETEKKIRMSEESSNSKILTAVHNLQLELERKIDHKIANIRMEIVGLKAQYDGLDRLLCRVDKKTDDLVDSVGKISGNQQAINESVKHFSDTIKWILTIGGSLFLSLLAFVLYKGL